MIFLSISIDFLRSDRRRESDRGPHFAQISSQIIEQRINPPPLFSPHPHPFLKTSKGLSGSDYLTFNYGSKFINKCNGSLFLWSQILFFTLHYNNIFKFNFGSSCSLLCSVCYLECGGFEPTHAF